MKLQITTKITDDTEEFERKFINKFNEIALGIRNDAKDYAPVDSSNLRWHIQIQFLTPTHAKIVSNANYSSAVEFGTKPHIIRPRKKKALAWGKLKSGKAGKKGHRQFVAKLVHHPGTKAIPFMRPARDNAESRLKDWIK